MLGRQRPFPPSVPAEAGCLFAVAAGVHVYSALSYKKIKKITTASPVMINFSFTKIVSSSFLNRWAIK